MDTVTRGSRGCLSRRDSIGIFRFVLAMSCFCRRDLIEIFRFVSQSRDRRAISGFRLWDLLVVVSGTETGYNARNLKQALHVIEYLKPETSSHLKQRRIVSTGRCLCSN